MAKTEELVRPGAPGAMATTARDAEALVRKWDRDIIRSARRAAARFGGGEADADDFAQVARLRLYRALRQHGVRPDPYIRRLIKNAVLRAAVTEARPFGPLARNRDELVDDRAEGLSEDRLTGAIDAVRRWAATLPARLLRLRDLLYVDGLSQRDAARALSVSQPRVAQLHADLLGHGRIALEEFSR